MPIYEFRCTECYEVSEEMLSFKSNQKTINCPVCGNRSEKIVSLGSFQLKGGGWCKDGYEKKPGDPGHRLQHLKLNKRGKIQDDPEKPFKGIKPGFTGELNREDPNKLVPIFDKHGEPLPNREKITVTSKKQKGKKK